MKRFTQSLLAAAIITTTVVSAKAAGINNDNMLTAVTAGDLTSNFNYDKYNRLTSIESVASKVTFDYSPVTIGGTEYDMTMTISDPSGDIVCYLEIGDNGYVRKSREIERVMDEETSLKTMSFTYDEDGRLTRINEIGMTDFSTTTFEYSDGDIVASVKVGDTPAITEISYSSPVLSEKIDNTMGVMDFKTFGINSIEPHYLYNAGLLGRSTNHLPVKSEVTDSESAYIYMWNIDNETNTASRHVFSDNTLVGATGYYGKNTSGISDIMTIPAISSTEYYDINGRRHSAPTQGINILNTTGGAVKVMR